MCKKILTYVFVMQLVCLMICVNIYATETVDIVKTVITDKTISAYVNTSGIESCTVQLGSEICKAVTVTKADESRSDTLILLDNSGSIPKSLQPKITELIENLIDGKQENEYFAIASLNSEEDYICDYTNDRYALIKAVDNIAFDEKYTYIYSALSNALKSISNKHFTKIVVISDGIENSKDGITYDEILRDISDNRCPVYTIGIEQKNQESLKRFFAFSRMSSAKSYTIAEDSDISEICSIINETREFTRVDIEIPDNAADGGVKYLKISASGIECGCDIRMPAIASRTEAETEYVTTGIVFETTAASEIQININEQSKPVPIMAIGIIGIGVLVIVLAVVMIIKLCKKEKKASSEHTIEPCISDNDETIIGNDNNATVLETQVECYVKITDINSPEISFRCALGEGIIIGRDEQICMVALKNDRYVSRRHCRIYRENGQFYIENLSEKKSVTINDIYILDPVDNSNTDIAQVGGTRILLPTVHLHTKEIFTGDKIRIGHTLLRFEVMK